MEFYIVNKNLKQGPYTVEELPNKDITANTMVWSVGFSSWKKAKDIPELSKLLSNLPPEPFMTDAMPKTWLAEAILVTCLCCLPLGIVGIIYATKVDTAYYNQQYDLAQLYSRKARKWTLWGFYIALIIFLLYIAALTFYIIASL